MHIENDIINKYILIVLIEDSDSYKLRKIQRIDAQLRISLVQVVV